MKTYKSYKFRLYPTMQQEQALTTTLETCRHLYNDSLGERSVDWDGDANFWNQKQLLALRKQDDKYLKQVHSQVLQDVLLRLDKSYQAFFKKLTKYPKGTLSSWLLLTCGGICSSGRRGFCLLSILE